MLKQTYLECLSTVVIISTKLKVNACGDCVCGGDCSVLSISECSLV